MDTYKIVRYYLDHGKRTLLTGLSLDEAKIYCKNPETAYDTATGANARKVTRRMGPWFDGFTKE